MKSLIIFFVAIIYYGCDNSKPKEKIEQKETETERLGKVYERIEDNLSYDKEKIILLSEIRKISFDTLNLILRDYYVITDTVSSSDENSKHLFQNAIAKISDKYKISKSRIATLLFSYKYEMITKEEIEESAVDEFKDNYEEEPPEPEDPY